MGSELRVRISRAVDLEGYNEGETVMSSLDCSSSDASNTFLFIENIAMEDAICFIPLEDVYRFIKDIKTFGDSSYSSMYSFEKTRIQNAVHYCNICSKMVHGNHQRKSGTLFIEFPAASVAIGANCVQEFISRIEDTVEEYGGDKNIMRDTL